LRNALYMSSRNGQHPYRLQASITRSYNEKPQFPPRRYDAILSFTFPREHSVKWFPIGGGLPSRIHWTSLHRAMLLFSASPSFSPFFLSSTLDRNGKANESRSVREGVMHSRNTFLSPAEVIKTADRSPQWDWFIIKTLTYWQSFFSIALLTNDSVTRKKQFCWGIKF